MPSTNQAELERAVLKFAREWFDLLNAHEPVGRLLPAVSPTDLEMVFPERTLRDHADFREWYDAVGEAYSDQTHTLEDISATETDGYVDVTLTVVWAGRQTSDGSPFAFRIHQTWRLALRDGRFVIVRYRVGSVTPA